jgi:hypothetical protein
MSLFLASLFFMGNGGTEWITNMGLMLSSTPSINAAAPQTDAPAAVQSVYRVE